MTHEKIVREVLTLYNTLKFLKFLHLLSFPLWTRYRICALMHIIL